MHRWPADGRQVLDPPGVEALAAHLLDVGRERPVAVATRAWGAERAAVDVEELRAAIGDLCDVVEVVDGHLTFRLSELLPEGTGVWDGAVRVYPADPAWQADPSVAPPRVPGRRLAGGDLQRRIEGDALRLAFAGGAFASAPRADVVSGVVKGFPHDDRALVALDNGRLATVPHELVAPDLPFDWVLRVGDRIEGRYEARHGRLLPRLAPFDVHAVPDGAAVLGLVVEVGTDSARLQLHPDVAVTIDRDAVSKNPLDTVDLLLSVGDVVPGHLDRSGDAVTLRLHDVDDDEPVLPAPPVVDGGRPWLELGRDLPLAIPHPVPTPAAERPAPLDLEPAPDAEAAKPIAPEAPPRARPIPRGPQQVARTAARPEAAPPPSTPARPAPSKALRDTQLRLEDTTAQLGRERTARIEAEARATRADREANDLERRLKDTEARLEAANRKASQRGGALRARARDAAESVDRSDWFLDSNRWARFEIGVAWAERVGASEKSALPLPEYDLDPRFGDSLRRLSAAELRKAMRAVVDVLVGRANDVGSREVHRLRDGKGGDDPIIVRPADHATCWRAYIENVTAQAKRLHWWAIPGGRIELIRIVDHDDTSP